MPITRLPTPEELQQIAAAGGNPQLYANKPLTFLTPEEQAGQIGTGQTIGRTAVAHAGGILGGGGGALTGGLLGAAAGSEVPIIGNVIGGIIGAVAGGAGGGALGQKAQEAIEPSDVYARQQQEAEEAAQQNPKTALATDIIGSAVASGGKPSLDALRAGKAIIGRLGGEALDEASKKAIAGTVMNAGINPAINTGIGLATGQGLPSGTDLAAQVAGGALFSRQAGWASKLMGHTEPAPEVTNGNESTTTTQEKPLGDIVTPYTKTDENGEYTIGNSALKAMYLKRFAEKVKDIEDPVLKAEAQTRNENLRNLSVDDMRQQLHTDSMTEKAKSILGLDDTDSGLKNAEEELSPRWQEPAPEVTNTPKAAGEASNEETPTSQASPAPQTTVNAQDFLKARMEQFQNQGMGSKVTAPPTLPKVNPVVEEAKARERAARQDNTQPNSKAELTAEQFEQKGNVNEPPKIDGAGKIGIPLMLQQHIRNGYATTGSILHSLSATPDHPFQPLAKALLNAADTKSLGVKWFHDPTLDTVSQEAGERSHYDPKEDRVNIGTASSSDARTVMEEAVHSLTSKKIPHFAGEGEEHYNRLNQYLKTGSNEHVKALIKSYFDTAKALNVHDQLFKDNKYNVQSMNVKTGKMEGAPIKGLAGNAEESVNALKGVGHSTKYAMGNLDEFLAQAIKDPEFQKVLDSIKDSSNDKRTVWQNIVDAVRNLLGLDAKKGYMLDRVLRTGGELVAQNRDGSEGTRSANLAKQKQTDTPEFKKWFGNSVLKDKDGNPLVVYHGTNSKDFDSFKPNRGYTYGNGIYLTPEHSRASDYAAGPFRKSGDLVDRARIIPVYAKLENPYRVSSDASVSDIGHKIYNTDRPEFDRMAKIVAKREGYVSTEGIAPVEVGNQWLREQGYDGIIKGWKPNDPLEIVPFNAEQVKSATGNRGTFDPNEKSIVKAMPKPPEEQLKAIREIPNKDKSITPDIRIPFGGKGFMDAISRARETAPKVADAFHSMLNARQQFDGDVYGKVKVVMNETKFNQHDGQRLMEAMRYKELNHKDVPAGFFKNVAQRAVWNKWNEVYKEQGQERIKDKQPVIDANTGQPRLLKANDNSYPLVVEPKVRQTIRDNTNPEAIQKLKEEFFSDRKKRGISEEDAQQQYDTIVKSFRGNASSAGSVGNLNNFNANRRAQGIPLPDSWTRQDFEKNLQAFSVRNAADRAHFKYIESNPEVMAQLGETHDAWNRPIKANPEENVAGNPHVHALIESAHGEIGSQMFHNEKALSSLFTAVNIASPALSGVHIPIANTVGMIGMVDNPIQAARALSSAIFNWNKGLTHATENGVKIVANHAADVIKGNLTAAERMQAIAGVIRKISTLNDLTTKGSVGFGQAFFESLIPSKIARANSGDVTAQQWLRSLEPSFKLGVRYDEQQMNQMATRALGYIHGTSDARTMPAWMLHDTEVSGFFSLAHWSVGQTNRFIRDIYTPATQGNYKPLMMSLFGSVIGGYIIKELREQISGKKSSIPSLEEIGASDRGFEGNKGAVVYNMIAAMQYAGFAGLFSQIAKYPFDAAYKNSPQGATFPLDEIITDTAKTGYQVATAIANDPNVNWVDMAKAVGTHLMVSNFRLGREAYNQAINHGLITGLPAEKKELSDKMGQLRRFDMVEGLPYNEIDEASNPYMNLGQKQFKMEQDPQKAMQMLPSIVQNIMQTYHDNPDVMMSKLKSLKENSYSTFPSMENMSPSFTKYIKYLQRMEGPEAAQQELQDYMKHSIINEAKASVVP